MPYVSVSFSCIHEDLPGIDPFEEGYEKVRSVENSVKDLARIHNIECKHEYSFHDGSLFMLFSGTNEQLKDLFTAFEEAEIIIDSMVERNATNPTFGDK